MKIFNEAQAEIYYSDKENEQIFNSKPKCKISWKVISTKSILDIDNGPTGCYGKFYIQIYNNNKNYTVYWTNQMWECVGSDTIFSTYYIKNIPKKWDIIYTIVNSNRYEVIKYGKTEYDKYPNIWMCEWNPIENKEGENNFGSNIILSYLWIIIIVIIIWIIFKKRKII